MGSPYNSVNTEVSLAGLKDEIVDEYNKYINNIPFINYMISPNRARAKDRPRSDGRIIVDLCRPHILEDMEYFRPSARHYEQYGCYTRLRPNPNPNSEFMHWFKEEVNRIWYGYVRPSDGEWIPGEMYFYLNYCPIQIARKVAGKKQSLRLTAFPDVWDSSYLLYHYLDQARNGGLYNDHEGGEHAIIIARRGCGKSFSMAAILARLFCCGDSSDVKSKVSGMVTAYLKEYLNKDQILNKFQFMIDFIADNMEFPSHRLRNSLIEMQWEMGYQDVDSGIKKGTLNTTIGISAKDNPDAIRGKRSHRLIYEEFGCFSRFIDTYNTSLYNVQDGEVAWGQIVGIGTGGTLGSDFLGAQEIIYHPKGYNVYALPNVFDEGKDNKSTACFFIGAYMNRAECMDKDGNSDVTKALLELCKQRFKVKYNTSDANALTQLKAELPFTIQDSMMRVDGTIYPVADLTQQLNTLDADRNTTIMTGRLGFADGKVVFNPTFQDEPIRQFPTRDNKLYGAIEVFELPKEDSLGRVFPDRYIVGADVYDNDESDTLSLGSTYVLDLWTDRIAACYTGRPLFADEFYEIVRKLAIFYNASGLTCYENNWKGLYTYFSKMNSLYLLMDTPEFLKDKLLVTKIGYGNTSKGIRATVPIQSYGRRCLRDWLLKPVTIIEKNSEGEPTEVSVPNLTTIKSRALLQELILWNNDLNTDRHDAMIMAMLGRESQLILAGEDGFSEDYDRNIDSDYLGNDQFFKDNYNDEKLIED